MMRRMIITQPTPSPGAMAAAPPAPPVPRVELAGVHPNPALGSARFAFTLERAEQVDLTVYDVTGRAVATLAHGRFAPGEHAITWDGRDRSGRDVPAGVYLCRLETEEQTQTQRLVRVQ